MCVVSSYKTFVVLFVHNMLALMQFQADVQTNAGLPSTL